MTVVVLSSMGVALGVIGVVEGLRVRKPSLANVLSAFTAEPFVRWPEEVMQGSIRKSLLRIDHQLGSLVAPVLDSSLKRFPSLDESLQRSLRLTDSSMAKVCSEAALGALAGLVVPVGVWIIISAGGVVLPLVLPVWACLVLAVAGASLPFSFLYREAKREKRAARRVVMTFLDLVVLCLAGGMGIEGALHAAANVGSGHVSSRLLGALTVARDAGQTPWEALAEVGEELGIDELTELAAAVGLAGSQGARIRSTLSAKAASIRKHELADAEAEAATTTEKLFLPGVLMLLGFLLFMGYPAVARITSGL